MKNKSVGRKPKTAAYAATKLRGVLAQSRGQKFGLDDRTKAYHYRQGMQHALMLLRGSKTQETIERALTRFDRLSEPEVNKFARQPINYDYLSLLIVTTPQTLDQEVRWLGRRIAHSSSQLDLFLQVKWETEAFVLADQPQQALEAIERLDSALGCSLWSVTLTISLVQWFYGAEAKKAFVSLLRSTHKRGFLPYLANYASQLCEETVSLGWYRQNLHRRLTGSKRSDITVYMESKLSAEWPDSLDDVATCLRVEQNHHEIDIYEAFIGGVLHLLGRKDLDEEILGGLLDALGQLDHLADPRLDKIRARLGLSAASEIPRSQCQAVESLLAGNLRDAYRHSVRALRKCPNSVYDAIVCASVMTFFEGKHGRFLSATVAIVVEGIAAVLSRTDAPPDLAKFCVMFRGLPQANGLLEFVNAEGLSDIDQYLGGLAAAGLHWNTLGFFDALTLGQPGREFIRENHVVASPSHSFLSLIRGDIDPGDVRLLSDIAFKYSSSFRDITIGDGRPANDLNSLMDSSSRWISSHAASLALRANTILGDINAASNIISAECCIHGTTPAYLAIDDVFSGLEWKMLAPFAVTIQFVNAYHLFAERADFDKASTYRRFALAAFLKAQGISCPSALRPIAADFDVSELAFFLGKVCIPQQIDMLKALRGSVAVLEERRAICSLIISLDCDEADEYEQEIVAISKELAVQQGLRAFDGSRVHVDRNGLKKVLRKELAESYSRYAALVNAGVGVAEDFDSVFRDLLRNNDNARYLLNIPENEADELLVGMIRDIRDSFLLNVPHGLDSYISKRVRHGSIVGHIRGPVEQEALIFQRGVGDRYQVDGRLTRGLPLAEADLVNQALISFSVNFDNYLIRLKDVLLHVRTSEKPLGVFDLTYNAAAVHLIRSSLKTDQTFEGLLNSALSVFWVLIGPGLQTAKDLLIVDASKILTEQLQQLRARIVGVVSEPADRVRIGSAITKAITGVQARLETAGGWFDPAALEPREYTVQEAIEIGVASVKAIQFGFDPNVTIETVGPGSVKTEYLPVFVDVLFLIFGNVAQHANCGPHPEVSLAVTHYQDLGILRLIVENDVSTASSLEESVEAIERLREHVACGELASRVRQEGGSGLVKLASIANQSSKGRLDFGYRAKNRFFVEMDLSLVTDLDDSGQLLADSA